MSKVILDDITTEDISNAVFAVLQANATSSASTKLKTENASANAKGFLADRVVTEGYLEANKFSSHEYDFCLREINFDRADDDLSSFSVQELATMLDPNGCDLAMMPLMMFPKPHTKGEAQSAKHNIDALSVRNRLKGLGLPIDVTIWFNNDNLLECVNDTDFISELTNAGYSVGYVGGQSCECPQGNGTVQNGAIVLDNVQCGPKTQAGHGIPTFAIGDNSSACKIRWIKPQ